MNKKLIFNKNVILNLFQNLICRNKHGEILKQVQDDKTGFTLAEVLITLTILGVVAAIAVPSLVKQNYNRTQVSRMAKAYAALENAATNIAQNTNCVGRDLKCTGLLDLSGSNLQTKFAELANFRVNQKFASTTQIYIHPLNYKLRGPNAHTTYNITAFITSPDNLAYSISTALLTSPATKGIKIVVVTDKVKLYDENGNVYRNAMSEAVEGRDVFQFVMYDNFKVEPLIEVGGGATFPLSKHNKEWYFYDNGNCGGKNCLDSFCNPNNENDTNGGSGKSCTGRIIKDGWKMNY